jgi:hypothetical protein
MKVLTNFALDIAPSAVGSARTLLNTEAGGFFLLDTATGSTATLPASVGDGGVYNFMVSVLATTNSHKVVVANTNDVIRGMVLTTGTGGTTTTWATNTTTDTITLNRTTTGSVTIGEWLEVVDAASGVFCVKGQLSSSGTGATPFSASV